MEDTKKLEKCRELTCTQPLEQDAAAQLAIYTGDESWNEMQVKVALIFLESLMHNVLNSDAIILSTIAAQRKCVVLGLDIEEATGALTQLLEAFERRRLSNPLSEMF